MTDYKAIKGRTIQSLASDLDTAEGAGQIWFNTTSGDYKTIVKAAGAWSTGGNMNTARAQPGGAGTQTAAMCMGGQTGYVAITETYNGSTWTEVNDLNTARDYLGGCGSVTAALAFGGDTPPYTAASEEYNGTSWTEGNDLPIATNENRGIGIQTAALSVGGYRSSANQKDNNVYDGSSWSAATDLNTARADAGTAGTSTAGIVMGGASGSQATETYLSLIHI